MAERQHGFLKVGAVLNSGHQWACDKLIYNDKCHVFPKRAVGDMLLTELQEKLILLRLQSTIQYTITVLTLFGSLLTGCLIKATQVNLFVPAFAAKALWKLAWWGAQQCKTTFGKTSTRVIHTDLQKLRLWGDSYFGNNKNFRN